MTHRGYGDDRCCRLSVQSTATQVVSNDDVGDGVEDKLNVSGISSARLVTVYLLHRAAILRLKLRLDVQGGLLVCRRSCKIAN